MSIKQLRTLVAVAEAGSFKLAAQRLFMTESAVSMQMKALEVDMKVDLFDRASRPPTLNGDGWRMVEKARRILESYDDLRLIALAPVGSLIGSLRLGVMPSVSIHLLAPAVSKLRVEHPSLRIQTYSSITAELAFKIEEKVLDVAVVNELERFSPSVNFNPISREELKVVIHKDLARGSVAKLLRDSPFVRFNPALELGRVVDSILRSRHMLVNDAIELDTVEAIIRVVKLKLGVTIIPVGMISKEIAAGLKMFSFEPPVFRRIGVLTRREMRDEPSIRAVFDAFQSCSLSFPFSYRP